MLTRLDVWGPWLATYTAMKGHMYVIADALAGAIAKQFPKQVS